LVVDAVLLGQQEAETQKRDWCEGEIQKKEGEQSDMEDSLSTLNATIARKSSEVESLVQEVDSLNAAIEESKERDDSAADLRQRAKSTYEAGAKDRSMALKVLQGATRVLEEFYRTQDHTSRLLQTPRAHKRQMPETFSGSSRHAGQGHVVIEMLGKISEDIKREQKDAEIEETEAAAAWAAQLQSSRQEFDRRMEEITLRVARKAKVLVQLDNHKETQGQQLETLGAVAQQLGGRGVGAAAHRVVQRRASETIQCMYGSSVKQEASHLVIVSIGSCEGQC